MYLYIDTTKITPEVKSHLTNVIIKPYNAIFEDLKEFGAHHVSNTPEKKLLIDQRCSLKLVEAFGQPVHFINLRDTWMSLETLFKMQNLSKMPLNWKDLDNAIVEMLLH